MNEFDDPQIERMLGAAGGAYPNVNTAFAQVQGRVRHIKRRRAMVASSAACLLLAAGAVFAVGRGDDRSNLSPASGIGSTETSLPETDSTPVTDSTDDTNTTQPTVTTHDSSSSGSSGSGSGSDNSGSSAPSTSTHTSTSNPAPVNIGEQTYTCAGGTITVKVVAGSMVLVSSQPAAGFTLESSDATSTRVEVRWRSATDDQRIRIDLEAGVLVRKV